MFLGNSMHPDELGIDASLVERLIARQFPRWIDLPIEPFCSAGTDNAIYRLGSNMAARLPRHPRAASQIEKEHQWLPKLAPFLPLAVPIPIALGAPAEDYPYHWSICQWIEGENATVGGIADLCRAATGLAGFVKALQSVDTAGGPAPGQQNSFRGVPLSRRDAQTRAAISSLDGMFDTGALTQAWDAALNAPEWNRPPVWLHGDLHPGNVLVRGGRLCAILDFGCLGVGDPACELMAAWTLFPAGARRVFRAALASDSATWKRGSGWALSFGVIALPYYLDTNPTLAKIARRTIDEVLLDYMDEAALSQRAEDSNVDEAALS